MGRKRVDGLTLRLAGTPVLMETLGSGIAGDIFVLSTTVPSLGVTCHSSYHGHEGIDTVVVRLALLPGDARTTTDARPREELPVTHARERCVLDHLAHVRDVIQELATGTVAIEVADAALPVAAA